MSDSVVMEMIKVLYKVSSLFSKLKTQKARDQIIRSLVLIRGFPGVPHWN